MPPARGRGSKTASTRGKQSSTAGTKPVEVEPTPVEENPGEEDADAAGTSDPQADAADVQSMEVEDWEGNVDEGISGDVDDLEGTITDDVIAADEESKQDDEIEGENDEIEGEDKENDEIEGENANAENVTEGSGENPQEPLWQVRVCPIHFEDLCSQRQAVSNIMKSSNFFEYRMSQHLSSRLPRGTVTQTSMDKDIPFLPKERTFTIPYKAATAGLLEMEVTDSKLVELISCIRSAENFKKNRVRYELKRLPKQQPDQAGETVAQTEAKTEKEVKAKEVKAEGEEMMEGVDAETEGLQTPLKGMDSDQLQVNFSVRGAPVKRTAFKHKEDYELKPKDKQIFLTKVPDEVPDNVLKAIMMLDMVERKKGVNSTGTAVFSVKSPLDAQGFMEHFDGILVNSKDIEMSTTLGTLYESKKKHFETSRMARRISEDAAKRRTERSQTSADAASTKEVKAMKRKPDSSSMEEEDAKKPRLEELSATTRIWISGKALAKANAASQLRSRETVPRRRGGGNLRGRDGRPLSRGGVLRRRPNLMSAGGGARAERGALLKRRGGMERGRPRGIPRASRGLLRTPRGIPRTPRGTPQGVPRTSRGPPRGMPRTPQGAPRTSQRAPRGRGRTAPRGGARGSQRDGRRPSQGGSGRPAERQTSRGDRFSPRAGGRRHDMEELQAKMMAAEREINFLRQEAMRTGFDAMERGAPFRGDRFSPRRGPNRRTDRYDDRY